MTASSPQAIIFVGMQDTTAESVKSLEGYRIAWIEQGQTRSCHQPFALKVRKFWRTGIRVGNPSPFEPPKRASSNIITRADRPVSDKTV
jgi:hypothetical protein